MVESNGEGMWESGLHWSKGELLFSSGADSRILAEPCYHQALKVARKQGARSMELRVATSLARVWRLQGKRREAHDLLAPVYDWFTEGFDTPDLKDAKALLEELK